MSEQVDPVNPFDVIATAAWETVDFHCVTHQITLTDEERVAVQLGLASAVHVAAVRCTRMIIGLVGILFVCCWVSFRIGTRTRTGKIRWSNSEVERMIQVMERKAQMFPASQSEIVQMVVADTILVCDGTLRIEDFER